MSSEELSAVIALKGVLERRGVLSEVRAKLRSEVYSSLTDESSPKPQLCRENLLINELIIEYLVYNQYNYTQSVLIAESGHPSEHLERDFLEHELNIRGHGGSMPLLYKLLAHYQQRKDKQSKSQGKTQEKKPPFSHSDQESKQAAKCTFEKPTFHNTS